MALLTDDAMIEDIYERSKVDDFIAGSEIRMLISIIRDRTRDLEAARADLAEAKAEIARQARTIERLEESQTGKDVIVGDNRE